MSPPSVSILFFSSLTIVLAFAGGSGIVLSRAQSNSQSPPSQPVLPDQPLAHPSPVLLPDSKPSLSRDSDASSTLALGGASNRVTSGTLRLLRTLEAFHKDVKTIHATFDQVREDQLFSETVKSKGE